MGYVCSICTRKCCRVLSCAMVCGVDGFPSHYGYYHAIRIFSLPQGKFSQNTRRHLQCDVRACGA